MNFLLGLLGGAGRIVGGILAPVWQWCTADLRNAMLTCFAAILLLHGFVIDPALRRQIADGQAALTLEKAAHQGTIDGYQEAAFQAAKRDLANAARVEGEQAKITEEIVDDYKARIADARSRAAGLSARLHAQTTADPGRGAAAAVPGAGGPAGGAAAAPGQDRFPASGLDLGDALIATEQAIQLDKLIDWVEAQARVDFNGEPGQ